jgi:putative endonuclease
MDNNQEIGRWGEEFAAAYLERIGYSILERNFFTREGEIDLVACREEQGTRTLIFVEVKTRTSEKFGYPEEAFTRKKWEHLRKAIDHYLESRPDDCAGWQVDVIAVQKFRHNHSAEIEHFENVVMDYDRE